ncbi:hypothetical protein [Micromonospora sp. NBC_01813]|uniref:hypothetical protein n=1 Tax=Micromonospora sp. NBC_01813 TaxID=2975988 RepID=UPI002DD969A2|nr:hypothetical protein [Micromonospora sp. NBC_01813]WSA08301.1 hypothetical protein OG958_29575 [Micromonospora sp. NBC_01813]
MKRHRIDGVSLTFGLIFSLIAGWWVIAQYVDVPLPRVGWVVAGGLILVGLLGLVGALRSGRAGTADSTTLDGGVPDGTTPDAGAAGDDLPDLAADEETSAEARRG